MNEAWSQNAKQLHNIRIQIKELEEIENELRNKLIALSDGQTRQDDTFVFEMYTRKGSVDYSKIPVLKTIDLEEYRKESMACWKLNLIEKRVD